MRRLLCFSLSAAQAREPSLPGVGSGSGSGGSGVPVSEEELLLAEEELLGVGSGAGVLEEELCSASKWAMTSRFWLMGTVVVSLSS